MVTYSMIVFLLREFPDPDIGFCAHPWRSPPCLFCWEDPTWLATVHLPYRSMKKIMETVISCAWVYHMSIYRMPHARHNKPGVPRVNTNRWLVNNMNVLTVIALIKHNFIYFLNLLLGRPRIQIREKLNAGLNKNRACWWGRIPPSCKGLDCNVAR